MFTTLTDPDRFFREQAPQNVTLSVLIVLVTGILNMTGALTLLWASWETIVDAGGVVTVQYVISVLVGIGTVFVSWMLYSGAFHVFTGFFDGSGEFRTIVTYVAWGFIPTAFAGLLRGTVIGYRAMNATFPDSPARLGPFVQQLTSGPMFTSLAVIGIICTVWSGFIWTFAVKHARGVPLRAAALSVVGPLLISIGWPVLAPF